MSSVERVSKEMAPPVQRKARVLTSRWPISCIYIAVAVMASAVADVVQVLSG